jgi:hypothetical protein
LTSSLALFVDAKKENHKYNHQKKPPKNHQKKNAMKGDAGGVGTRYLVRERAKRDL